MAWSSLRGSLMTVRMLPVMPVSLTYVFHVKEIGSSISTLAWLAVMLPLLPAAVDTR